MLGNARRDLVDRIRFKLRRGGYMLESPWSFHSKGEVGGWLDEHMPGRWRYMPPRASLREQWRTFWQLMRINSVVWRQMRINSVVWRQQTWRHRSRRLLEAVRLSWHGRNGAVIERPGVFVFQHERDRILFQLRWSEEIAAARRSPFGRVVLPIIRKVMPQLTAAQIIGVQSMTAPVAQSFTLRARYAETEPSPPPPPLRWWQFWKWFRRNAR